LPYLLLTLTVLFWSGNFIFGRALSETVPPVALSFWRWVIALIFIFPFVITSIIRQRTLIIAYWKLLLLYGFSGVAGFSTLAYLGLTETTAINGILLNTSSPVFIILINRLFFRQAFTIRECLGVIFAFFGVLSIVSRGDVATIAKLTVQKGDFYILGGVLSWAIYTSLLRLRPSEMHPLTFLGSTISLGVLTIFPFFLFEASRGKSIVLNGLAASGILYLALFPSIVAYLFWNYAVEKVGPNRAGFFLYLMPVFGTILSRVLLKENLFYYHLLGIFCILCGIYLATLHREKNP